jgi:hypothetical protein
MQTKLIAIVTVSCAFSAGVPAMAAQASNVSDNIGDAYKLSMSAGADFSSGSYGATSDTRIVIAPIAVAVKTDAFRFGASVPYIRIDGPGGVVVGPDGQPLPGVPTIPGSRSGVGDLSLSATYSLPKDSLGNFEVDLTGRVKLPTSKSSEHLGTGKTDYTVSADVTYPVGAWGPFVTVGYRVPGKPAGVDLNSSLTASVGTSLAVGRTVYIASYDYTQAISPLAKDGQEIFTAVSVPAGRRLSITGYGIAGLSKGSPSYEAGLLFTAKLR